MDIVVDRDDDLEQGLLGIGDFALAAGCRYRACAGTKVDLDAVLVLAQRRRYGAHPGLSERSPGSLA